MNIPAGLSGEFYEAVGRVLMFGKIPHQRVTVVGEFEFDRMEDVKNRLVIRFSEGMLFTEDPFVVFADFDTAEECHDARVRLDATRQWVAKGLAS